MSSLNTQVYQACRDGHREKAKSLLLNNRISQDFTRLQWPSVTTSLHEACRRGWLDIVQILVEKCGSFSSNIINKDGESPLHYACHYGRFDILKYFIKQGSNPRMKDKFGREPVDIALLYDQINIACYLCQNYISSAELLAPDRMKKNFILVRKILQHDLWQQLLQFKTTDGDIFLNLVFHSSSMIEACMSSKRFAQKLKSVTNNKDVDTVPHLIMKLCHDESNVACLPSAVMSDWLSDTRLDIEKLIVSCNWKTADSDTVLQIVFKSKSCVSRISSVTMRDWLTHTNTDLLIEDFHCETADHITVSRIIHQIDSKSFERKNVFSHNTPICAIITPHWETVYGHSSLKVLFRSELYISCRSSTCLTKWLSKTSLDLNRIVAVNMKTDDDESVLKLLLKSESCILRISSKVMLRWLKDTKLALEALILLPNLKTLNGYSLLQIVCNSKSCVSRISSATMRDWLIHTDTDLLIDDLYYMSSDCITLLTIMHQIDSKTFKHRSLFSHDTSGHIDAIITPHWETDDSYSSLRVLFRSDLFISCESSVCLIKWLCKTSLDLDRVVAVKMKTTDGKRVIELLFNSESYVSCTSSGVMLRWLTDTTLDLAALIVPNWKTADGETLLQLICNSKSFVSRISSITIMKWLTETTIDISNLVISNWTTADGDTLLELIFKSESCVSCISSEVMLRWLTDKKLNLEAIIVPNWKTANGSSLLQIVCNSKSCVSRISSATLKKWLTHTNSELLIDNLYCVTSDRITLLKIMHQIDSKLFYLFSHNTSVNAIVTPHWETDDGHSSPKVLLQSKFYISCESSTCLMKWLSNTSLDLSSIITTDMKTIDDERLLELLLKSESCVSRITSKVMLRWLTIAYKTLSLEELIVPNWKTANGYSLLQIVCKSKGCVSRISSVRMRDWLTNTNTDLLVDKLDYVTSDNITLLTIVDEIGSKSFEYNNSFTPTEAIIAPHWETVDGYSSLKILLRSELYISCESSTCLIKWLSKTSLDLNRIVAVDMKTTDDERVLELLFKSESCISHISSKVILRWLTDTILSIEELIVPSWKTADGHTLLQLICNSESFVSRISSKTILKWLVETNIDVTTFDIPNWTTADGDTLPELLYKSEEFILRIPSTMVLRWLTNAAVDLSKSLITPNWKTANGDTLLHIICQSKSCVSRISSETMKDWLTHTNTDLLVDKLGFVTSDNITLLTIMYQIESKSFEQEKIFSHRPIYAIITPHWDSFDGHSSLKVLFQSEMYISCGSSTSLMKWLSKTTLDLNRIVNVDMKISDGGSLFQLSMFKSEACISRISSTVMVKWLTSTKYNLKKLIVPNWETADGDPLLQLVCKSESCMSRTPSSVIMNWLESTVLDLKSLIVPNLKTADDETLLQLVCCSEICLSQITSKVILNWLHESNNGLHESTPSSIKTADGDTMLKILFSSESTFSHCSSSLMLKWINEGDESTIKTLKTANPNWKTADGDVILHLLCRADGKEHAIIELLEYYLQQNSLNPNLKNNEGNTAIHLACKFNKNTVVIFLLTKTRCDINVKNNARLIPLDMSMDPEIIFCLCEYDCSSLSSTTVEGWLNNSALINEQNLIRIFKLLVCKGAIANSTLFHLTCCCDSFALVCYLLSEVHCDPNCQDSNGLMPIQVTTDLKIMKTLVQYGAKVTSDVVFKVIANTVEQTVVTEMLLLSSRKKTLVWNPEDMNEDGDTALHLACKVDKAVILKFLVLEGRCDPNCKNVENKVPLELSSNLESITILIEQGAIMTPELLLRFVAEESIPKHLLPEVIHNPDIKNSDGNTALHLACKADEKNVVKVLLSKAHCDPNIKNNQDGVPLQMTTNLNIIKNLIKYGAHTSMMYESHKSVLGTNQPIRPPVKVFVVGNASVGKSTLTAALKTKLNFMVSFFTSGKVSESDVKKKTAGIVPHEFNSDHFGRVTLYDFAGHREFYSSHAALLQAAVQSTPPIFLLVVNLCDEDSKILEDILYWISFLENQCALVSCKPLTIIIGSHADTLKSRGVKPKEKISTLSNLLIADYFINLEFIDFIAMNCQLHKSVAINDLRRILVKSCEQLRIQEPITFNAHCFLVYLIDSFSQVPAVTIGTVNHHIEQQRLIFEERGVLEFLPIGFEALYKICLELNDRGHILFLKDKVNNQNSYVVIDKELLLSKVSGTVFASKDFDEYKDLATNTGVVSQSNIAECFPNIDIKILLGFLSHLEFCHEISDQALHQLIIKDYSAALDEHYYLFPDLISVEANKCVWETNSPFKFHFGWILQCTKPEQFFSSRFLQVLLLRLAFSCALKSSDKDREISISIHRKCSLWKNGVFWGNHFGMDMLVEIIADRSVIVMARFNESNIVKCIKQRSQVIRTVLDCIEQFCPRLSINELLIDSSLALRYPYSLTSEDSSQIRCTVKDLAEALVSNCESPSVVLSENGNSVQVETFILFEPYSEIEAATLMELWEESNADKVIPDLFLSRFVRKLSRNLAWLVKVFNESTDTPISKDNLLQEIIKWRDDAEPTPMTYKQLRQKLDEHSILAGRNILVSIVNINY